MSLTVPNSFKVSNITENWVIMLGHGKAFDSTTTSNKLNEALDSTETGVDVDDGSVFAVSDYIRIGTERMKVSSISTNTLTVIRGIGGTATTHSNNDQIYFDNFTTIGFSDTSYEGEFCHGVITSEPSIRESINLESATSKTSNISISLANFAYKGSDFSAELFNGDRDYINRACFIYIFPTNEKLRNNGLLVYSGRLTDFSHNHDSISLSIVSRNIWDDIEIPQIETIKGNYYPIAYGDFRPNASQGNVDSTSLTFGSSAGIDEYRKRATLYPIPIEERRGAEVYALTGDWTQTAKAWPHYYEKSNDTLIPIADHASNSSTMDSANEVYSDGYATKFHQNLLKDSFVKLKERKSSETQTPFTWASNDNAFDGDYIEASSYTQCTLDGDFVANSEASITFSMPQLAGYPSNISIHLVLSGTITLGLASGSGEIRVQLIDESFGASDILGYYSLTGNGTSTTFVTSGGNLSTSSAAYFSNTNNSSSEFIASSSGWGEDIKFTLKCVQQSGTLDGNLSGNLRLFDVAIESLTQLDFSVATTSGKNEAYKFVSDIDYVYSGGDGLPDNGWNSSSAITEIHEAHRDLLQRFTNFTDANDDVYSSSNHPGNWSDGTNLNSIKDWKIRYWINEPTLLIKALEELQLNGGFIGRYNSQGNYHYIFVPDSITTDHTITKADIADIEISLTPFSGIITSMDIDYEKHPARSGHVTKVESSNTTSISDYNIGSKEKTKKIKLNALVSAPATSPATNPNDDWYTYQNNLIGEIKHILSFSVINPSYFGIDVGDFVAFDDIGVNPFGGTWSSRDFIVISVSRKRGQLKIKAKEV